MGIYNLDKIFKPASIAVIGASEKEGSIGRSLMENLIEGGYEQPLFPVNPRRSEILGKKSLHSIAEADIRPELAVIATPIKTVPGILRECVEAGVKGVIIISAGGRESGEEGRKREAEIEEITREGGVRAIGPNCMGIISPARNLNASFAAHMPLPGRIAFISQSGAICSAMLDISLKENMGFRYFVSIGSMMDVDFGDLVDYLGNDPKVESILLYIESLTRFRKFMSAAREVSRVKPIVVIKSGRSAVGARAAASHTGAMAGEDVVYDAAFRRAGIARVKTLQEFFDCSELLAKQPSVKGRRLVIVTNAGGPGVMAADSIAEEGLELSTLSQDTLGKLNSILPSHWSRGNPIDILGDATAERYREVANCCFESRETDGMLVIINPQAMTDPSRVAETLAGDLGRKPYPVFAALMGGKDVERGREVMNAEGIPTYETPERAVSSFAVLYNYSRYLSKLQEIPSSLPDFTPNRDEARRLIHRGMDGGRGLLNEIEAKRLLSAYDIPVNETAEATSEEAAVQASADIGFPLVMKILSPDISHKTEAGGVKVGIRDEEGVRGAYRDIMRRARDVNPEARLLGVNLQGMVEDTEVELLIGAKKDVNFGPVILFGMGGIFAEVVGDRALGLPPLNRTLARRLMEQTKAYKILQGFRNRPPADLGLLEQLLVRLSHLLVDFPEISEMDMNPVMIKDGRPVVVDARMVVEKPDAVSPHHLVISPYPAQYESLEVTSGGLEIFVRPIKPEDASMLMDLFHSLSPKSRYFRFFSPMKSLSENLLIRLTQVDYDRHIALVAVGTDGGSKKIFGVARIISGADPEVAEFSVAVGDPWQGKGVGRKLLEMCIRIGKGRGVRLIEGTVLSENVEMLNLGRELGFKLQRSMEGDAYTLKMEISHSGGPGSP